MIKFFRKIRQKLIQDNKAVKYILYAFGEIILVVIGIIIALWFNDRSEERQAIEKAKFLLAEVMDEAEMNYHYAKDCRRMMMFQDSTGRIIANDDTYIEKNISTKTLIMKIGFELSPYKYKSTAYNNFYLNSSTLPEKYQKVLPNLEKMTSFYNTGFTKTVTQLEKLMERNSNYVEENYFWYSLDDTSTIKQKGFVEFTKSDYRYKSMLKRIKGTLLTYCFSVFWFTNQSKDSFYEIGALLEIPKDSLDLRMKKRGHNATFY